MYEVCSVENRMIAFTGKPCVVERGREKKICWTKQDDNIVRTQLLSISYLARVSLLKKHATYWTPHHLSSFSNVRNFVSCLLIPQKNT